MLFLSILGVLAILYAEFRLNRDAASPVFLMGAVWLWAYFLLVLNPNGVNDNLYCMSFCIALGFFFVGVNLFACESTKNVISLKPFFYWNPIFKGCVFIVEYVLAVYIFFRCFGYIQSSSFSAWMAIRQSMVDDEFFSTGLLGAALNVVPLVYFVSLGNYLSKSSRESRIDLLISIPPVFISLLFSSRGNWFFVLITSVYMIVFFKKISNKKIAMYGLMCFALIIAIWIWSSLDKFKYTYVDMSDAEKIVYLFNGYFINPILNFFHWFEIDGSHANGLYTFRFVCAIMKSFGVNVEVVPTILPFMNMNGVPSNVYTALNWYARDFGILWAFVVYFLLGLYYGKIYRHMKIDNACNLRSVLLVSMLMTPLAYQFFAETFLSTFSIWCQRFITLFILTSPYVLVKKY